MKHQYYEALARIELSNAFEPEDAETSASTLRAGLASFLPFVDIVVSTLGGKHRPTIMIKFSLDPKSDWANGIMQNSRYALMRFEFNGSLEHYSGKIGQQKFRKTKVKDVQSAVKKIKEWVEKNK